MSKLKIILGVCGLVSLALVGVFFIKQPEAPLHTVSPEIQISSEPNITPPRTTDLATLTGNPAADETLARDFGENGLQYPVLVKSVSPSRMDETVPLATFLKQFTREECPECEAVAYCEPHKTNEALQYCMIEWTMASEPPQDGQDLEPTPKWTLEYEKTKITPTQVQVETISASWRDF
jgi:hypothetical protein